MAKSSANSAASFSRGGGGRKRFTTAGVLGALVLIGYTVAQPHLNARLGWNLPAIQATNPPAAPQPAPPSAAETTAKPQSEDSAQPAERRSESARDQAKPSASPPAAEPAAAPSLKYGILRDLGRERYLSPAGLQYTPGSQEGHRLEHLKRHLADQPSRAGSHGVFEGDMEAVLRLLDQAYGKAKANAAGVTEQQDQDRTIYTVDMGKRIGYVGGRDGNRRRKPMARRLRIVLEGTRVITAYPL